MSRSLLDVVAEVKAKLGDPPKQAAAFAECDWRVVLDILKREGNPSGVISCIGKLIGSKRSTLSKRAKYGTVTVHGRGPAPVIPPVVAQALSSHYLQHQVTGRSYPFSLAMTGALDVAGRLGLRPDKTITPRMMKRALSRVRTGTRLGELTGANRTMSVAREPIKAWTGSLALAGMRETPPGRIYAGDETDLGERGRKRSRVRLFTHPPPPTHPIIPALSERTSSVPYHPFPFTLWLQVMAIMGLPAPALGYEAPRHVTFLPIFSADGKLVARFFFVQGKRLMDKYLKAWEGSYVIMTESGGIDNDSWMALYDKLEMILDKPGILLLDGHGTRHSDQKRLYEAQRLGLKIVLSPANSTHKTQVHDVKGGPLSHFKPKFRDVKDAAMHGGMQPSPENLIAWCKEGMDAITDADGVVKGVKYGFRVTHIYPFTPEDWADKDFEAADELGRHQQAAREAAGLPGIAAAVVKQVLRPLISPEMLDERMSKLPRKKAPFGFVNSYEAMAERVQQEELEAAETAEAEAAAAAAKEAKTAAAAAKAAAAAAATAERLKARLLAKEARTAEKAARAAAKAARAAEAPKPASAKRARAADGGEALGDQVAPLRKRARVEEAAVGASVDELERRRALSRQRRAAISI
jgi:hypothetical protein